MAIAEQVKADIDYIRMCPLVLEIVDYSDRIRWSCKLPKEVIVFLERHFKHKFEGFSCPNPFNFYLNDTICHIITRIEYELDLQ
jgi:hypothetical protein